MRGCVLGSGGGLDFCEEDEEEEEGETAGNSVPQCPSQSTSQSSPYGVVVGFRSTRGRRDTGSSTTVFSVASGGLKDTAWASGTFRLLRPPLPPPPCRDFGEDTPGAIGWVKARAAWANTCSCDFMRMSQSTSSSSIRALVRLLSIILRD